jgi:hypothetical protein
MRKQYSSPQIIVYGELRKLTLGTGSGGADAIFKDGQFLTQTQDPCTPGTSVVLNRNNTKVCLS